MGFTAHFCWELPPSLQIRACFAGRVGHWPGRRRHQPPPLKLVPLYPPPPLSSLREISSCLGPNPTLWATPQPLTLQNKREPEHLDHQAEREKGIVCPRPGLPGRKVRAQRREREALAGPASPVPRTSWPSWDKDLAGASTRNPALATAKAGHTVPSETLGILSHHYRNGSTGSPQKAPEPR